MKHTWKFRESYKTLYEDLKFKFSAMMRSTKKIREANAQEKRVTKINENLLMRFMEEKHKKLKLGCWQRWRVAFERQSSAAKKFNQDKLTQNSTIGALSGDLRRDQTKKLEELLVQQKGYYAFRFHRMLAKIEKGQGLADLLKQKIEELESQKFHQKREIEAQYELIAELQKNLKETREDRDVEVNKLIIYKKEAEFKKPTEI